MNFQKIAVGAIAATIFLFLMDWIWYGMLMKDNMNASTGRPEPDFMWLVIGYLVFSFAFVAIYMNWAGGSSKVNSGLNFGLWTGLMAGLGLSLIWYAVSTVMTLSQAFMEGAYTVVKFIIIGIIVAYATNKPATAKA
jgi:hypothetical protein